MELALLGGEITRPQNNKNRLVASMPIYVESVELGIDPVDSLSSRKGDSGSHLSERRAFT